MCKSLNVFVQIAERQNSNTISFVFHWQRQNGKNIVSWSVTRSVILNSHPQILSKEYMMLLYLKDSALSMCHFTLAFLHRVISNVSSNRLPERMHTHTGCICFAFLHCAFSNVSSNRLPERMQSHIGHICLTFLHCEFSNVSSNWLPKRMHSHIGCICLTFLHCAFSNVPWDRLPEKMHSHTACICSNFPHCVFSYDPSNLFHKRK